VNSLSAESSGLLRLSAGSRLRGARLSDSTEAQLRERWRSEPIRAAFEAGRQAGQAQALENGAALLSQALDSLEAQRVEAAQRLAQDAAMLAVEIARELVRAEIRAGRHDIERIVRETLAVSGVGRGAAQVHVSPKDAQRLAGLPFRANTTIEADPALREGDVHVTAPQGLLVREMDDALNALRERLRAELCP
jgi:flagellar biosynthesis/type III secretory pathway protein FliH